VFQKLLTFAYGNNPEVPLGLEVVVCAACTMDYYFYVYGAARLCGC
jgi:hypothetical protein